MRFSKIFVLLLMLAFLATATFAEQQPLTNDKIVKLIKGGFSDETVINMIGNQPCNFNLDTDAVLDLKEKGVSEKVINAMLTLGKGRAPATASNGVSPTKEAAPPLVDEIGAYFKKDGSWIEIPAEPVNWQSGGVMKGIATAGIIKKDKNGRIQGAHSKTTLATPVELLFYLSEGTSIQEYVFIKLRANDKNREFRAVTGGVFHESGGATRDQLEFESQKIAPRTYLVKLNKLEPGEYGFLPPGGNLSGGAAAQLGKMYTIRLAN
jgi:hypothetical protein